LAWSIKLFLENFFFPLGTIKTPLNISRAGTRRSSLRHKGAKSLAASTLKYYLVQLNSQRLMTMASDQSFSVLLKLKMSMFSRHVYNSSFEGGNMSVCVCVCARMFTYTLQHSLIYRFLPHLLLVNHQDFYVPSSQQSVIKSTESCTK
jgi:hypothetical protein